MLAIDVATNMIILDTQLKSWLDKALKEQCKLERERSIKQTPYFLIGSFSSDSDIHVAHAVQCPLPGVPKNKPKKGEKVPICNRSFDDEWIAERAAKVIRLLPGGIHIVGMMWLSTAKVFDEFKPMITRALARIQRINNNVTTMNLEKISDSMALVFVETPKGEPNGIVIDTVNQAPESVTKVNYSTLEWVSIVSNAASKVTLNIPKAYQPANFYRDFTTTLKQFAENLFECDLITFEGDFRKKEEPLVISPKNKKKNSVDCHIFVDACSDKNNNLVELDATNLHEITFDIEIRASVPVCSKVEAAMSAVKQHIIRSLMSRAEMLTESLGSNMALEGPSTEACTLYQLPRIATTILHYQTSILLTDYLFEADSIELSQKNYDDVFGLQTSIESVDDGWERHFEQNEEEFFKNALEDIPIMSFKPKDNDDISCTTVLIVLAVIVAVISVVVYLATGR